MIQAPELEEVEMSNLFQGYDADWSRDALKDRAIHPCIPGRKSRGTVVRHDKRC